MSLGPVNIDFLIGGNVDSEGKKVESQLDKIVLSAKQAKAQIRSQIVDLKEDMKETEAVLKDTEKRLKNMAPGKHKLALEGTLNELRGALQIDKESLSALEKKLNSVGDSYERLTSKLMHAKDVLAKLEVAGMKNTEEWRIARGEVEKLSSQLRSVNKQTTALADPQRGFKAVAGAVSGFTGAMTAAVGVASLFGAEAEELARIQTRLQAVMAIAIGVQQVAQNLNKESYVSVVLLTKAKHFLSAANIKLATTFGISTAAAKTLMATLTLGLSVAITGIIVLMDKLISKSKEAKKEQKELMNSIVENAKPPIVVIEDLAFRFQKLGDDMQAKEKFVKQNKKAFEELGVSIQGVTDAENLLIYNKEAFKEAQMEKARSMAYTQLAVEEVKNLIIAEEELKNVRKSETFVDGEYTDGYGVKRKGKVLQKNKEWIAAEEKVNAAKEKLTELIQKSTEADEEVSKILKQAGIDGVKDYAQGTIGALEKAIAEKREKLKDLSDPTEYQKQLDEIKDLQKQIDNITGDNKTKKEKKETAQKESYNAAKDIQNQLLEINRQTADLLFQQKEDNLQKTLDAIDNEKNAELNKITEKEQAIIDKYNKDNKDKKGFTNVTTLAEIDAELANQQMDAVKALEDAYSEKRRKTEEDYYNDIKRLAAEAADSRVKIENDYETQIKKAREAGLEDYVTLLEKQRDEKIAQTTVSFITESEAYKLATNERLLISKESTEKLIGLIKKRVEAELEAGKISKEKAQEILDSINLAGIERGYKNNPFQNLINSLKEYKAEKDKINTAKSSGASEEELIKLEASASLALKTSAEAAATSIAGVRDVLATAVDGLDQLGLLTEEEKKTAQEVIGMVSGAASLATGIASGNPVQIIQGSIELLVNTFKLFDKKSKDIERAQKKHKSNLDELTRAYTKLQREVDKALGTDGYKKQREQIANLKKRVEEYYKLIELEEQKKKKKQDAAAIEEWKAQIDELRAQMEDIVDDITQSIAQTSALNLAEELAQALVDAFSQGESAADAMGKVIDDVLKRAVINALKLKYLEKPLQGIIDTFADDMESGGGLSQREADRFRKSVEAIGENYYKAIEEADKALGGLFTSGSADNAQAGIKGDVASMSEQTGSALVGQLNAMRLNVSAILSQGKNTTESMTRIFATMERIKDNTEYCRLLERIDSNIQYLKQNGIEVK